MTSRFLAGVLGLTAVVTFAQPASAGTITAFEEIGDSTCTATATSLCTDQVRDLYRLRQVGAGPGVTENTDANITGAVGAGGNAVDGNFGQFNVLGNNIVGDVTYTHVMTWLSGWPIALATAELQLFSYGASGNNDGVLVDSISLGNLSTTSGIQTTTFTNGTVLTQLVDGLLTVTIDKSNNNEINLFRSILTVSYDDGVPGPNDTTALAAPEPASLLLLGSGLGLVALMSRRRAARR